MGRSPIAALNGSKLVVGGGFGITTYDTADHDQTQGYPFPRFTTALTVDASRLTLYIGDGLGGITAWQPTSTKPIVPSGTIPGPIRAMILTIYVLQRGRDLRC